MSEGLTRAFKIITPAIPSAGIYFFTTDSGITYEVRFGRRKDNVLHATIVFGVINEEYEGEEYVETNSGEVYRVMATLVQVVRIFMTEHNKVRIYEFNGTAKKGELEIESTARINLYKRYLPVIFPESEDWVVQFQGSNAVVSRKGK